ncbi:MAG: polysaccharide deacetylase family protein, partial [Pricia sp.]|nr:polysaccharide deacetylase family protein [Pricia sp.]
FIWFYLTILGSFMIRLNYHFKSYHSNTSIDKNWVAITFDDGPNQEYTPRILQLLAKFDAKATFFCIGQQVEKNRELLKTIIAQGHTIGNHTYSHSQSFGFFGLNRVISDLKKNNDLVQNITGLNMRLYRPAFGVTNPQIGRAVEKLEILSIGWNIRSLDTTSLSAKTVLKRITREISKGDIILLHDTSDKTVAVLEQLLLFLQQKNLQSVTVDQLLEIEAYA